MADTIDAATAGSAVEWLNVKVLGEAAAQATALAIQNQVALQQATQALTLRLQTAAADQAARLAADAADFSMALKGRVTQFLLGDSPAQAAADQALLPQKLVDSLSQFNASLAAQQGQAKIVQTLPPQTGTGGAFGSDTGSSLLQSIVDSNAATASTLVQLQTTLQAILAGLQALATSGSSTVPVGK